MVRSDAAFLFFDGEVALGPVTTPERVLRARQALQRRRTVIVRPGERQRRDAATVLQRWWRSVRARRVAAVRHIAAWWTRRQDARALADVRPLQSCAVVVSVLLRLWSMTATSADGERWRFVRTRWAVTVLQRLVRRRIEHKRERAAAAAAVSAPASSASLAIEEKRRALREIKLKRMLLQSQLGGAGAVGGPSMAELVSQQRVTQVAENARRVLSLTDDELATVTELYTQQNAGYRRTFRTEEVVLAQAPPPGRHPYRYSAVIEHEENKDYSVKPAGVRGVRWNDVPFVFDDEPLPEWAASSSSTGSSRPATPVKPCLVPTPKKGVLDLLPTRLSPMVIARVKYMPPVVIAVPAPVSAATPAPMTPKRRTSLALAPSPAVNTPARRRDSLAPKGNVTLVTAPPARSTASPAPPPTSSTTPARKPPTLPQRPLQRPLLSQGAVDYPYKWINDSIHGHIQLDKAILEYVDTEQFQRLRDLKQMGSAYLVFPGASHNRFEHSLGTCHLAGTMISRFQRTQPELGISDVDVMNVKIAGLCHDLGHGPFSHVFDNEFIRRARPGSTWTHEEGSQMMIQHLVDDNQIDVESDDLAFIKRLIDSVPQSEAERAERGFMYEIVANKRNSVDVDKFDYISRDCHNVGLKTSYDFDRLINLNRVINNEICYHSKEIFNMYEMFHTRYSLFKRIYTHRVGKAIELMITDALVAADPYLHISDMVHDPEQYLHLTDSILHDIAVSKAPELERARSIIKDLRRRHLYKFVDDVLLSREAQAQGNLTKATVTPKCILEYKPPDSDLSEDDLIVDFLRINYAMKDNNPVDRVKFYSRYNDYEAFTIDRHKVSFVIPETFEETIVRVFARNPDKMALIQATFRNWVRQVLGGLMQHGITPNPVHNIPPNFQSPRKRRDLSAGASPLASHSVSAGDLMAAAVAAGEMEDGRAYASATADLFDASKRVRLQF